MSTTGQFREIRQAVPICIRRKWIGTIEPIEWILDVVNTIQVESFREELITIPEPIAICVAFVRIRPDECLVSIRKAISITIHIIVHEIGTYRIPWIRHSDSVVVRTWDLNVVHPVCGC